MILQGDLLDNQLIQYAALITAIGGLTVPIVQAIKQAYPKLDSIMSIILAFAVAMVISIGAWFLDMLPSDVTWKASIAIGIKAGLEASGIYGIAKGVGKSQHKVDDKKYESDNSGPTVYPHQQQPLIDTSKLPPGARG